jgi:hypothetical protein
MRSRQSICSPMLFIFRRFLASKDVSGKWDALSQSMRSEPSLQQRHLPGTLKEYSHWFAEFRPEMFDVQLELPGTGAGLSVCLLVRGRSKDNSGGGAARDGRFENRE